MSDREARLREAIYAAAYIRFRCDQCDPPQRAHDNAEQVADEWLEMQKGKR